MSTAHYEKIADEIASGDIDRGAWVEAFAASQGDERATKAHYIKLRIRKLRSLGFRAHQEVAERSTPGGRRGAGAKSRRGVAGYLVYLIQNLVADIWTAWLWALTFTFAALTAVGALCIGTMFYLKLFGGGAVAWPFFTIGCAFLTFFLFGRGVHQLLVRTPSRLFYMVEIVALCAALWPVSNLMGSRFLNRLPESFNSELVYLLARFLPAGNPVANLLTAAVFFLPVYGVIAYLRQQKLS